MRGGVSQNQEDDYDEECPSLAATSNNNNSRRDGKSIEKVNAMRSKHSVTEQKRRSKINERFQILRDLMPHSDQKRDTASFLLEVIEYVQFLQEKVHKFEGSFQGWTQETSKLLPWRNNYWGDNNYTGDHQQQRNLSSKMSSSENMASEVLNPLQQSTSAAQSDGKKIAIEGGTICIATNYSEELLRTLTQALESAGVDLSHANISVQIDVGNRANRGFGKDTQTQVAVHGEEGDHTRKRVKTSN